MKTIRLIGMTLLAAVMCTSFISCNSSDDEVEVPSPKTINIGIKGIGEILNITELPLSKSTGNDLYAIQVYKKRLHRIKRL